jgi:hypothetical protein
LNIYVFIIPFTVILNCSVVGLTEFLKMSTWLKGCNIWQLLSDDLDVYAMVVDNYHPVIK